MRISPKEIKKKGKVPKNGNIFFTIFQTFTAGESTGDVEEAYDMQELSESTELATSNGYFGDYPKDFFDLIIIDECHRGGAKDESSWREILGGCCA